MRKAVRSAMIMFGFAYRADPMRTTLYLIMTILDRVGQTLIALWLKLIIDGAIGGDTSLAITGALAITFTLAAHELANWVALVLRTTLVEKTGFALDLRLLELSGETPGLEHHERPDYVKELELLRAGRGQLSRGSAGVIEFISLGIQMITSGALLYRLHPSLLFLPLFAVPSLFASGKSESIRQKRQEKLAEPNRAVRHLFGLTSSAGPAKEMRIFGLADELLRRYRRLWEDISAEQNRSELQASGLTAGGWLVFAFGHIAAIIFVVVRAVDGLATAGDVILALTLSGQVNQQVGGAAGLVGWLQRSLKVVGRYLWLEDYAANAARVRSEELPPASIKTGIEITNLSFSYPGTDTEVLTDVTLSIPRGGVLAIVGENGAGKTTLVKLLCRFYEPTSGSIAVDGLDLGRLSPAQWRENMSAGFQDFIQFELLLRETVGVGDVSKISDVSAVERALQMANASDVTSSLTNGLEAQLGKRFTDGTELSTGQWQKLALSRAMMRPLPLLLILDEPTASLDVMTESSLFERYVNASRTMAQKNGGITILVSHRFSTVRMADRIAVMEGGRMVELGTHKELVDQRGLYAELYSLQASAYRD